MLPVLPAVTAASLPVLTLGSADQAPEPALPRRELRPVPLALIDITDEGMTEPTDRGFAALVRSLQAGEPLDLPVSVLFREGRYEVLDGRRRVFAARRAGLSMVDAVVICVDDLEAAHIRVRQRTSAQRRTHLLSLAWLVSQLWNLEQAADPHCRREDAAQRLGLTESEMRELIEWGDAIPESDVRRATAAVGVTPERITRMGRPSLRSLVAAPEQDRSGALRTIAEALAADHGAKVDGIVKQTIADIESAQSSKQTKPRTQRAPWRRWAEWLVAQVLWAKSALRRRMDAGHRLLVRAVRPAGPSRSEVPPSV